MDEIPDTVKQILLNILAEKDKELFMAKINSEMAKTNSEMAKINSDMAKTNRDLLENLDRCSLRRLLEEGLTHIALDYQNTSHSTYTSNHNEAFMIECVFSILDYIKFGYTSEQSLFLINVGRQNALKIIYNNKSEIEPHVLNIVTDVMSALNLNSIISLRYQNKLVYEAIDGRNVSRSDIWVVKSQSGYPIAVIEVKQPGNLKLSNQRVLGEVFDYMLNLRSSFGQCEIFGLVTTLDEWRVVWFPDSNEYALRQDLSLPSYPDLNTQFSTRTLKRDLSCSAVYSWHDPNLFRVIATFLLKSMKTRYLQMSLLSSQRAYITLNANHWMWGMIQESTLQSHPEIFLTLPRVKPETVTVLREFRGGADGQVFLALTNDFHLVVIKKFFNSLNCEREYNIWKNVYEVDVLSTQLNRSDTLIMPFVFHCCQRGDGDVVFDFNMSSWGKGVNLLLKDDHRFEALSEKFFIFLQNVSNTTTPENALRNAVNRLANACLVHNDLEWRHVALLPIIAIDEANSEQIIDLIPILIDLASVTQVSTVNDAKNLMEARVSELLGVKDTNNDTLNFPVKRPNAIL